MIFNNTKHIDAMLKAEIVAEKLFSQQVEHLVDPMFAEALQYIKFKSGDNISFTLNDLVVGLRRQFDALAAQYRGRANHKGWGVSLTGTQLFQKWIEQGGRCVKTNRFMEFTPGTSQEKNPEKISLDRVDNDYGYYIDNVRFLTHFYNNAKSTWGDELVDNFIMDSHNHMKKSVVFDIPV